MVLDSTLTMAAEMETTNDQNEAAAASSSASSGYDACNNRQALESETTSASEESPKEYRPWRKPWLVALALFFSFYLMWFQGVVIKRYWVDEDFGEALPGLDKTALRKTTIRLHLTCGGIAVLCSPIQMITPFTSAWKKRGINWYRRLHRYSGRLYVACAVLSYLFGQWFICLKEFALVGGYNMGVAFSCSGFAIAYFAYMTWISAPTKNQGGKYTVQDHRNYAIRSFSQIIAPILYRYWYIVTLFYTRYHTPNLYLNGEAMDDGSKLDCDDRDVCDDYKRPWDAFYCWFYWISAWAVAELVILCLPKHQSSSMPISGEEGIDAPLVPEVANTADDSNPDPSAQDINKRNKTAVLNSVGIIMVVLTLLANNAFVNLVLSAISKKRK